MVGRMFGKEIFGRGGRGGGVHGAGIIGEFGTSDDFREVDLSDGV